MDATKSSISNCVNVWSAYQFSTASESKIDRISYQHKDKSAFCFLSWTKVTLLVLSKSDSSKHEITPLWLAQQWTQALLRASFKLPRFSTALIQPQHSQFTSGWFCLPANQHRYTLEDTAQKSKTLLIIYVFPISYPFSVSLSPSLAHSLSLSPIFLSLPFLFSNRFLGLAPLQCTRMVY